MTNSYPTGSPGVPDSMPTGAPGFMPRRSSYASVVAGAASGQSYPSSMRSGAFSHLLNQHIDSSFDPAYQTLSGHLRNDPRAYDMDFGANGSSHGRSGSWTRGGQLPSFSSAFGSLVNGYGHAGAGGNTDHFFIPSYLKGSKYVQKLEEAHIAKVKAYRDGHSAPSSQPGSLSTSGSSVNLHSKMAASHRGMTYDVIEKAPLMEDESLPSLPSKWSNQDKHAGVEVLSDGQEVKFIGSKSTQDRDHEASAIRADHPMPPQCGIYYYEVTIISRKREESSIGIGFSSKTVPLSRLPGWEPDSWAYHGDDGHSFCCQSVGKQYGPPFTAGDVIGCGVNFRTGSAFFTKNGDYLGPAFREINNKGKLYPSVGMKKTGEHIRVNFGQRPFVFDIDGMMSASNNSHSLTPSPLIPFTSSHVNTDTSSVSNTASSTSRAPEDQYLPNNLSDITSYGFEDPNVQASIVTSSLDTDSFLPINTTAHSDSRAEPSLHQLLPSIHELVSLPSLISLPQPTTLGIGPNESSSIQNRIRVPRPHIPIGSFSYFRDAARAELTQSGVNLQLGEERFGSLLAEIRALLAESLANNGSTIDHPNFSPAALQDLNRIVHGEQRMARGRDFTLRRRTDIQEAQFRDQQAERRFWAPFQARESRDVAQFTSTSRQQVQSTEEPTGAFAVVQNSQEYNPASMARLRDVHIGQPGLRSVLRPEDYPIEPFRRVLDDIMQDLHASRRAPENGSQQPYHNTDTSLDHVMQSRELIPASAPPGLSEDSTLDRTVRPWQATRTNPSEYTSTELLVAGAPRMAEPTDALYPASFEGYLQTVRRSAAIDNGQHRRTSHQDLLRREPSALDNETQNLGSGPGQLEAVIRNPGVLTIWRPDLGDNSTHISSFQDISTMTDNEIQQEKLQIRQDIEATSTSKIAPPLSETELIQSLVLQFLTHDGYVETAKAFADEVHAEKRALSLDPNAAIHGFDVREDEDAGHRQRIRAAILEGDIDKALKHTNAYYPHVLKDDERVYFRLRCRKFIEMIRQGAEMQNLGPNGSKKSNGHNGDWYDDILNHDMELDDHQGQGNNWDRMDTEDSSGHQVEYLRLLDDTLAYGKDLQAEFKDDPRREVSKALEDAFALMAYSDPLNAKEVSHLLDPSGRLAVAEELNSSILQSLGKSSSAALEQLYQQTTILLEDLREGGGPGAFVNIDDFVRPRP